MGKRTIYMVRHGQYKVMTGENEEPDGPLTALGREQAALTGERLTSVRFDHIYLSTLVRTIETADIIAAHHPTVSRDALPDLREAIPSIPVGFEAPFANIPQPFLQESAVWCQRAFDDLFVPAMGETEEMILLVAHGNIIAFFASLVVQAPVDSWIRFDIQQASLCEVYVTERLMKLVRFNDVGHLPPKMQTFV